MDEGGVKLGAGGLILGIVVAFISRLRRPKALRLEDKSSEVNTLAVAVTALDTAMRVLSGRLDQCEKHHAECTAALIKTEKRLDVLQVMLDNPAAVYNLGEKDAK